MAESISLLWHLLPFVYSVICSYKKLIEEKTTVSPVPVVLLFKGCSATASSLIMKLNVREALKLISPKISP